MTTWIDDEGRLREKVDDRYQFLRHIPHEHLDPWINYDSWDIELAVRLITIGYNLDIKACWEEAKEWPHGSTGWDSAHAYIEVYERGVSIAKSSIAAGLLKTPDTPANWLVWAKRKGYDVSHLEHPQSVQSTDAAPLAAESESLIMQIDTGDGTLRDALPVRAIPYVTGWDGDFGIPPWEVAIRLQTNINLHAWDISAYRVFDGKPVIVQPIQWVMVASQLAGFSEKLHRVYPRNEHLTPSAEGVAEWQSQAAEKLPARAFVWLDEFKAEYRGWFGTKFKTRPNLAIPEFDLTPLLSEEVRKMVLEGFEVAQSEGLNTKTINGREVVPLRLLPFASHWLLALTVAQSLAHKNPSQYLKLTGYHQRGNKLISIRPRQWDELVERLLLLEKALKHDEKLKFEDANYIRYTSESRAMLPVDVVVDCAELKAAYFKEFLNDASDGTGYLESRPGDNDLDFNCYLSQEQRRLVFGEDITQAKQNPEFDSVDSADDVTSSQQNAPATDTAPENDTAVSAPIAAVGDVPAKRKTNKPSIESVALVYMRKEYHAAHFESAAKFHKHLIKTAGVTDSPFEMGTGPNARKLFCPAASSFYDAGTLGKIWAKIRAE